MKKISAYLLFLLATCGSVAVVAAPSAGPGLPGKITAPPMQIERDPTDGKVLSKVIKGVKVTFDYNGAVLKRATTADGKTTEYTYDRHGVLDGATLSSGATHTALRDSTGSLAGFISTSGRSIVLRKPGNGLLAAEAIIRTGPNAIALAEEEVSTSSSLPERVAQTSANLAAIEGWDTSRPIPMRCGTWDELKTPVGGTPQPMSDGCFEDYLYIGSSFYGAAWGLPNIPHTPESERCATLICDAAFAKMDSFCRGAKDYRACNEANWNEYSTCLMMCRRGY